MNEGIPDPQTSAFLIRDNGFLLKAGWLALRHLVWQRNWDYSASAQTNMWSVQRQALPTGLLLHPDGVRFTSLARVQLKAPNSTESKMPEFLKPTLQELWGLQTFTFSYHTDSKSVREKWTAGRAPDEIAFVQVRLTSLSPNTIVWHSWKHAATSGFAWRQQW